MKAKAKSLEAFAREQEATIHLRRANATLSRQLTEERMRSSMLREAVYEAALAAFGGLEVPPVKAPKLASGKGEETAVVILSDWQLGKVTTSYNSQVCAQRIELLARKVVDMVNIQRAHHPVRRLHVWLLGDVVEGEMIFGGQAHMIDGGQYRQVTTGIKILQAFLRTMLANFDTVHAVGVVGNHGSVGGPFRKEYDPETNMDRILYSLTRMLLEGESRLTWNIPDGRGQRNWYAVDRIGEKYACLLAHGDQLKGHAGFPFYGLAKKTWGWATGAVPEHFDEVAIGHWHQPTRVTLNRITARVNGSTESHNDFAAEQLAAVGRPSQWLLFVHPGKGRVTAEYCVWLDETP